MITLKECQPVRKIYHISDIHVMKSYDRDEEYKSVINKLCEEIEEKKTKNDLIVCTGDVFDNGYSPSSILLVKYMMVKLANLLDVIIIRGNHDGSSRSNSERKDFLQPILYELKTENEIFFLQKSGTYEYGNILFGYTDYYDKNVYTIKENSKNKIKIGLWHGTINGVRTNQNYELEGIFNKKSFESYDYVLLGDIHKHEYLTPTMWYSGSLIQLNYGETISCHGYVELDLKTNKSKHIEIENEYGFLTVYMTNNKVQKYEDITHLKFINLRIIYENTTEEEILNFYKKLEKDYKIISFSKIQKAYSVENINNEIEDMCDDLQDDESVIKKLIDYIKKNQKDLKEPEIKQMHDVLNEKIKEINFEYGSTIRNIKLKNMSFSNFNIYGENNHINFEDLHGIINLSGRNGSGKSSIIQALVFCLYGVAESTMISKYDYINSSSTSMSIEVVASVNNVDYKIVRNCYFRGRNRDSTNFKSDLFLYKNEEDISGKNIKEIEKQIIELFGKCEEFLQMCIMEQKVRRCFIEHSNLEKTEYLCKVLKLDVYNKICSLLDSDVTMLKRDLKKNDITLCETSESKLKEKRDKIDEELTQLTKDEKEENECKQKEQTKKIHLECEMNEIDDVNEIEQENKIKKITKELKKLKDDRESMESETEQKKNQLETQYKKYINVSKKLLNDWEESNDEFMEEKQDKIKEFTNEINRLTKKIVNVNKNIDIKELKTSLLEKQKEMSLLTKKIKKLKEEIDSNKTTIDEYKEHKQIYTEYVKLQNEKQCLMIKLESKQQEFDSLNEMNQDKSHLKQLLKELEDVSDELTAIEKTKHDFENKQTKKINTLTKKIEEKYKQYTLHTDEINIDELELSNDKIQEEIDKNNNTIKKNDEKIKKIVIIDIDEKYDECLEKKYEEYTELLTKIDDENTVLSELKKKCKENENYVELTQNMLYDDDCEICMKNKAIVKDNKNKIKLINVDIANQEKKIKKMKDDEKKLEKYKELFDDRIVDIDINNENELKIKDMKKNNELLIEINKNKSKIIRDNNYEITNYKKNVLLKKEIEELKEELDDIKLEESPAYKKYNVLTKKKEELVNEINILKSELKIQVKKNDELGEDIEELTKKIKKITSEMSSKQKFYSLYTECESLQNEIDNDENELKLMKKNEEILKMDICAIEEKIDEYTEIKNYIKQNEEIYEKIDELTEKKEIWEKKKYEEYERFKSNLDECEKLKFDISKSELCQNKLSHDIDELEHLLESSKKALNDLKRKIKLEEEYENIKNNCEQIEKKISVIVDKRMKLSQEIGNINAQIEIIKNHEKDAIKLGAELNIKTKIRDVMRLGFIDELLTNEIIPNVCKGINEILSSFVNFRINMEYESKKIYLFKIDKNGKNSNAAQLSGYESLMFELAFRIYINKRNKLQNVNFFVIDEGFSFCDEVSMMKINHFFDYLRKLYSFAIIVSHSDQIKSFADRTLEITQKGGRSCIRFSEDKAEKEDVMDGKKDIVMNVKKYDDEKIIETKLVKKIVKKKK
jgi:exonuclease SbcC